MTLWLVGNAQALLHSVTAHINGQFMEALKLGTFQEKNIAFERHS